LRILKEDGLIITRQGSGAFARERAEKPISLRPYIEQAFRVENVAIDFMGYTAETLHGMLTEPLDKIRDGRMSPQSVTLRLLLADMTQPLALPRLVGVDDPTANEPVRQRVAEIGACHVKALTATVEELQDLGLVPRASIEIKVFGSAPAFKAYVLNKTEAFFGIYPVTELAVTIAGEKQKTLDLMGKDTMLFHFSDDGDPESRGTQFVGQITQWFDSMWNIAKAAP
jgi:hypothetical protein